MVTIYDIAEKANVSAMTVSRVINNTGRISDKTRAKVKKVMEELNYVPNQMARSLVLQQTRSLFLLITDITNPFYTTLSRGAEDAATKNGYRLLFGNSDESLEKEADYINTILTTRVDGVMIAPAGDPSLPHLESLQRHNIPFVLLDREVPGVECDIVLGDSKEGARQLVNHLASQGHRRIAMVNGSDTISSARLRLEGYREALILNGLTYDEKIVFETSYGPRTDLSEMEAWMDSLDPLPTAIVAGNNVLAIEVIRLLRKRNLGIPEHISIVCFDDFGPYSEVDPFMTVAAQQAYQFGYLGMQMLIDRIQNKDEAGPWKKIVLPAELIIRRSVSTIS
ncbi:LacI family transcriptional regulator [Paenibacillus glycanilyticus]|uniref:LacI family DNA-binding transcriptional regulator n=1 Tax=Paenibacillus glycanilyticus TaxID=126569 RepID=UPI00203B258E|nr:LacI family DNA-binding transcriptional regulator [Paenibacillus glycanilyticus]MCM3628919.1 LacI family transcriptional regulator [Paenibacillus glycanilyticus]